MRKHKKIYLVLFRRKGRCCQKPFDNAHACVSYIKRYLGTIQESSFEHKGQNYDEYFILLKDKKNIDYPFLRLSIGVM